MADGNNIRDPLAESLQTEIGKALGQRAGTVERFTFGAENETKLINKLTLGLSARAVHYPAHRLLLSELRRFKYGAAGASGKARMGARSGADDDVVIALALAWWAVPEGALAPVQERILLGSSWGGTAVTSPRQERGDSGGCLCRDAAHGSRKSECACRIDGESHP